MIDIEKIFERDNDKKKLTNYLKLHSCDVESCHLDANKNYIIMNLGVYSYIFFNPKLYDSDEFKRIANTDQDIVDAEIRLNIIYSGEFSIMVLNSYSIFGFVTKKEQGENLLELGEIIINKYNDR